MTEYCRRYGGDDWRWGHFDLLDAELPNIWKLIEVTRRQGRDRELVELRNLLTLFLSIRGHWDRRVELATAAAAAAASPQTKARIHIYDLCYVHLKRGEIDAARVEAMTALRLLSNRADDADLANVKRHLGRIAQESGQFEEAAQLYRESRVLYVQSDEEYGAFLDWDLGDLAAAGGNKVLAATYFESAYFASKGRSGKSEAVHAMAARSLGETALEDDDLVRAQELLEEAHQISFAVGRADEMALSSLGLGSLWATVGEREVAIGLVTGAMMLFRQLGDRPRVDECEVLLRALRHGSAIGTDRWVAGPRGWLHG